MQFVCTQCGAKTDTATMNARCSCGGLFEIAHAPQAWDAKLIDRSSWSIWRYRAFFALEGEAWRRVSMGEGMTPTVEYEPGVFFKMDYFMPTLSFKDRGAATLVAHMAEIGVKTCVQDSSGNAGNAVAAYCARAGIGCEIYVPEGTSPKKITMIEAHGAKAHVIKGTRDHCADVCRKRVFEDGVYYANHVYNPFFYEGMKAYINEVFEERGRLPSHIFVPLGNGTLFIGVVKALEHLAASGAIDAFPQVVALQSELCDPFCRHLEGSIEAASLDNPAPTIAEGIAIGKPMRAQEIVSMIKRHNIQLIRAPEDKLLATRAEIARRGIFCEHTTAANLAAYRAYCEVYGKPEEALISMCGAGLKSEH